MPEKYRRKSSAAGVSSARNSGARVSGAGGSDAEGSDDVVDRVVQHLQVKRLQGLAICIVLLLSSTLVSCNRQAHPPPVFELRPGSEVGQTAANTTRYLSTHLPGRSVGTAAEAETVAFLSQQLRALSYDPSLQPFTYEWNGKTLTSYNIIAERPGSSGQQILIGAHYDNAPTDESRQLEGTNDNASGVGVALELAQRLPQRPTHSVKFILFGAEEIGKLGSEFYAASLTAEDVNNSLVMLNLDSLIVGDKLYFNGGRGAVETPDWFRYRDMALKIAQDNGIAAETNPGLNPRYPKGTGCCSDSESFDWLMPVLVAEATNWDLGEQDGYTQTANPQVPDGKTWHDPARDNLKFTNQVFPGAIESRTHDFVLILSQLLEQLAGPSEPSASQSP